jgi:hypothetical protein
MQQIGGGVGGRRGVRAFISKDAKKSAEFPKETLS